MKYQILWLAEDKTLYSNYSKNIKELKRKIEYFTKTKHLKLNNKDRFNNLQVSKKVNGKYLILSAEETLHIIKRNGDEE